MSTEPERNPEAAPPQGVAGSNAGRERPWPIRATLYPRCYTWYLLLSALDLIFTRMVIHMEGSELNVVADWVMRRWDLRGLVAFKFLLVTLVICICEVVGRRNQRLGLALAVAAAAITAVPVGLTVTALATGFMR